MNEPQNPFASFTREEFNASIAHLTEKTRDFLESLLEWDVENKTTFIVSLNLAAYYLSFFDDHTVEISIKMFRKAIVEYKEKQKEHYEQN